MFRRKVQEYTVQALKTICLFALFSYPLQALTLVNNGKSDHSIVLSAGAPASEKRAARELQRFLEEMSGAKLPVVTDDKPSKGNMILVGESTALGRLGVRVPFANLGNEGFVIQTSGKHLIIAGGKPRGTLYGVYTFLDKLGCRWFTREVSRIPKRRTIEVAELAETHKPAFENREPFFTEAWDKDWAARNRTNGDHTELDESTGGKLKYYPFVHSFYELLPPDKYFAEHPEYYSLIDGKRRRERGQLCLTNPEVLRIATSQVEKWIEDRPDTTIFSVSQNDYEGWCECDKCRREEEEEGGEHSGPVLRFVNAVAQEIGKRHPDKLIDTLAYWYTENPPLKARPAPNVRIRLCPIGICVAHSFASCPRSAYFRKNLEAWSKITNQLYIWHYNTNFSHYLLPFPDFDELAADVPLYKRHGVVGLFMQGAYAKGGGGEQSELRAYVLARQLWDPSVDVSKTVDEFLEGVYGAAAAKPMREYFELLHRQVRPPAGRHLWIFNVPDYSIAFLPQAQRLFDRAEALASDDAARRRIRKARLPVEYYQLLRDTEFTVRDGVYSPPGLDGLKQRALALLATMRTFGIESIHEGQPLARDEERWKEMKSLRAYTMENAAWRVDVVPELNGRVIRMVSKASGEEQLRQFPPGESGYPNNGGQLASFHGDYQARAWEVSWSVERQSQDELVLRGRAENGARITRTLRLTGEGLHTQTVVENGSAESVPVAIQSRVELSPGDVDEASFRFTRASGEQVVRKLIEPDEPPASKETWDGSAGPAGVIVLQRSQSDGFAVKFSRELVSRCTASWTAKSRPGITFGVWSEERVLAPGASLRLDADFGRVP